MGIRNAGLAAVVGFLVLFVAPLRAQDVQLAAVAPPSPAERCLHPGAATPRAIVAACNAAIAADLLDGRDRALGLYHRGRARQALGDATGATADLRKAADQYNALMSSWRPEPGLVYGRATVWHALGEADKALADYDLVARLAPRAPLVFLNRGIVLARFKGSYALAMIDFDRVLLLQPDDPRVLQRVEQERAAVLAVMPGDRT